MIRSFEGKTPKIADSAFVSEAAYVVGDVEIGEHSSVWPGAVVRGDSGRVVIGKNTAVEDNSVIHCGVPPDADIIIGDMVHIGHGAVINCRRIGNNVLVGMNSTLLHDVEIGNMCIIGAGCMVSQGMKVPDNSFIAGVPGVIKGPVSKNQVWWVEKAPLFYSKLGKRYQVENL